MMNDDRCYCSLMLRLMPMRPIAQLLEGERNLNRGVEGPLSYFWLWNRVIDYY